MLNINTKLITATALTAILLSLATPPIFAANNFFDFGENSNWEQFFDNFFKRRLNTELTGVEEIPGPGDPDAEGDAQVKIRTNDSELCVDIDVENIDQATAAHIHHAPKGSAGAVVVTLPIPDAKGEAEGCVDVNDDLLQAIKENPQDYYINVHNNPYPNGAMRGQLAR